jgi:hypothetical protein
MCAVFDWIITANLGDQVETSHLSDLGSKPVIHI